MKLINIINEFVVNNVQESIKFYQKNLGFEIEQTEEETEPYTWVEMKHGEIIIMLEDYNSVCKEIKGFADKTDSTNLIKFKYRSTNKEIEELYQKLRENKVPFFMEVKQTDYGTTEFGILDPDKNRIIISS